MNKRVYTFLFIVTLVSSINQECSLQPSLQSQSFLKCPQNSACQINGWCKCHRGYIGQCLQKAHQMQEKVQLSAKVTHQQYTFFQIRKDNQEYSIVQFKLCHQSSSEMSENIDIWRDNGTINIFTKENAQIGGKTNNIHQGCITLTEFFVVFANKPNGQRKGLVLGLKLNEPGEISLTLQISIEPLGFWQIFSSVLLLLFGGCFFTVFSMTIYYLVNRWGNRHRMSQLNHEKVEDISHIEQYMPKVKLTRKERKILREESCSVCLLELGSSWLRKTICGHLFHQKCLDEWCKTKLSCPICRQSFEISSLKVSIITAESSADPDLTDSLLI